MPKITHGLITFMDTMEGMAREAGQSQAEERRGVEELLLVMLYKLTEHEEFEVDLDEMYEVVTGKHVEIEARGDRDNASLFLTTVANEDEETEDGRAETSH